MMKIAQIGKPNIDQVNIILMVLSAMVAYIIPFELVLFSYAFLGPAHYLTQISWMQDRKYFVDSQWLWVPFSVLTLGMVLIFYTLQGAQSASAFYLLIMLAFSAALALTVTGTIKGRFVIGLGALICFVLLSRLLPPLETFVILLLPSFIHIFIFTGAFILLGALKSGSKWGYGSFLVFCACALSFFIVAPPYQNYLQSWVANNIGMFEELAIYMADLLSFGGWVDTMSTLGLLSFAYTYHYLNWFSKVDIIGWHKMPKRRLSLIAVLYVISIAIYLYDYILGFKVLLFLSILHVILEFPLNILSFKMIGGSLKQKIGALAR